MPKAKLNPILQGLSGSVYGITFRRMHGKQVIIKKPDMSGVTWSESQAGHRQRFRQAVAYARTALADPQVRAKYERAAAKKGKRPFDLAVSDFFHGKNLLQKT
ncbi:MAG TPA: hypothetical protein VK249_23930 [Anaerolineales bacterium]|nr:hypothetical protein [Anaerolineales bacterium]